MEGLILVTPEQLQSIISNTIKNELSKLVPPPALPATKATEPPVSFRRMLEVTGLKERTARTMIAKGDIKCYQQGGRLYFFESELIANIKGSARKSSKIIAAEASDYLNKNRR